MLKTKNYKESLWIGVWFGVVFFAVSAFAAIKDPTPVLTDNNYSSDVYERNKAAAKEDEGSVSLTVVNNFQVTYENSSNEELNSQANQEGGQNDYKNR